MRPARYPHPQEPSRRKFKRYARPTLRRWEWILPRVGHGDGYFVELNAVVGWEDRGRLIVTVLTRDEAEHLRDTLTAHLSAPVDHGDGHN